LIVTRTMSSPPAVVDDPWAILTRRDSELATMEHPGFDVLHQLDLVAWSHRWRVQVELEETWQRRGIAPKIVYRTDGPLADHRHPRARRLTSGLDSVYSSGR
jgi:hypothetical protein